MQDTVVGLLREHLSHQMASRKSPPLLSETPNAAEVHNTSVAFAGAAGQQRVAFHSSAKVTTLHCRLGWPPFHH
jgi:hypothetical protein